MFMFFTSATCAQIASLSLDLPRKRVHTAGMTLLRVLLLLAFLLAASEITLSEEPSPSGTSPEQLFSAP